MAQEKVNECILLTNLYYSIANNTWVEVNDDGTVTVGMTDVAQSLAGPILHAKSKSVGVSRRRGKPLATVESGKWVGPLKSPVTGEIIEVNKNLVDDARLLNKSPYKDGWVVKMKPVNLEEDLAELVTGDEALAAYREKIETDGITCTHIEGSDS